jgi:hypothetical protein
VTIVYLTRQSCKAFIGAMIYLEDEAGPVALSPMPQPRTIDPVSVLRSSAVGKCSVALAEPYSSCDTDADQLGGWKVPHPQVATAYFGAAALASVSAREAYYKPNAFVWPILLWIWCSSISFRRRVGLR